MIIIMKREATEAEIRHMVEEVQACGMQVQVNHGVECTVLGVLGDTYTIDKEKMSLRPGVERVMSVQEPYKKSNRKFHPDNTVIPVGNTQVGGDALTIIAGPCSVESQEQINCIAESVCSSGANILRGGAFKPRTSPYAFQGLEAEGLEMLKEARRLTGMPIISEIMSPKHMELFDGVVDIIQVGARNMQNFDLLKEVGRSKTPVLVKRGLSSTIEEWLMSAEYVMSTGNPTVILCERGIRTFETFTRNTLDLSSIPALKKLSHLPVLVDPSHAAGKAWMVEPLAMAAISAGADGIMIEVHNDPENALCDGPQSVTPSMFNGLMKKLQRMAPLMDRHLPEECTLCP